MFRLITKTLSKFSLQRTRYYSVIFLVLLQSLTSHLAWANTGDGGQPPNDVENETKGTAEQQPPLEIFKNLLKHKRAAHQEALQSIVKLEKHEKQYKMIHIILDKIFTVMVNAKVKLMEAGFAPGDPMPTEENQRDAFANTVENTMLLGDILLRFPDITHDILKKNKEWDISLKWAISFVGETDILSENDSQLMHLVSQELNIVERDPNFVNPYTKTNQQEAMVEREVDKILAEKIKELERKKKRKEKKKKGPRLSQRTEL